MAFPKFFKKKEKKPTLIETTVSKEEEKKAVEVSKKEEVKQSKAGPMPVGILLRPHITEKATVLTAQNQYVFQVAKVSSKKVVAKAVEQRYGVHVEQVRIINIPAKQVRLGKTKGVKKGYKKAIVQLVKGQTLEIIPR